MAIIEDNSDKVKTEVKKRIALRLGLVGVVVERRAKLIVVVRTGTLKRSLTHEVEDNVVRIGTNIEYGPFVELGTSKMSARPYLVPALMESQEEIVKIFSE